MTRAATLPVGTRIQITRTCSSATPGMKGTIVKEKKAGDPWYAIKFDEAFVGGHDLDGFLEESGCGHFILRDSFEVIYDPTDFD